MPRMTELIAAAASAHETLGRTFALLNALVWAGALICFKKSGETVPPAALNLFKNVLGFGMVLATIAVLPLVAPGWAQSVPAASIDPAKSDFWILAISGILGIAVADTIFFYALNRVGVGLMAIIDCLYSPLVVLFSALLLGERLTLLEGVGAVLIVGAVALSAIHPEDRAAFRRSELIGAGLGFAALAFMAFGIVFAKPVLNVTPVLWSAAIRFGAGIAASMVVLPWIPGVRAMRAAFTPSRAWAFTVPGAFLGAYLAMIFWIAGFTYTSAAVAGVLNQTSSVLAILLAAVFLRDRITWQRGGAIAIAMVGVALVLHPGSA